MNVSGRRTALFLSAITFATGLILQIIPPGKVDAAQITNRKLTLLTGTTSSAPGSQADTKVNHRFDFTIPTDGNVGSIKFEYCTIASGTCVLPTGVDTDDADVALAAEDGVTGFTLNKTTNGAPYLTRTAAAVDGPIPVYYILSNIKNPTAINYTFYVRISTYASTDTTGSAIDTGTVAASTARQIVLTGVMPESLIFCTGATVGLSLGIPDCSTATTGTVSFNQLFSPTDTATASSQMAASTNAGSGYSITVNGPTLTSGSNTIAAMAAATTSVKGTGQFGMNLVDNATPDAGTNVAPAANGSNFKGQGATNYGTADTFKFTTGDSVADSANGGAGATDIQIFTVTYIANVSGSQTAGTYTTTLTYICTATF